MSASAPIHESPMTQRDQKALGFHQKYLNLSSEDERRSYGFGTTGRWDDRILIFGWTIPLKILIIDNIHKQYILCLLQNIVWESRDWRGCSGMICLSQFSDWWRFLCRMMGNVGFHQEFYCLTWVKKKTVSSGLMASTWACITTS